MRYTIKGREIRSENAAKPATDAAAFLVSWLHNRQYTPSALDFGCGKLRYTRHLAHQSKQLGLVDSTVQITRSQLIYGKNTSVQDYVTANWPSWRIHTLENFWKNSSHCYHFVLCANVLSAIPCAKARARSLRAIHSSLHASGQVLFVNQHTNSYFREVQKRPSTHPHMNGWIAQSKGTFSYYGILDKDGVSRLIERYGFSVEESWVNGQSNYVIASKGKL